MVSFKLVLGILFVLLISTMIVLSIVSYQNSKQSNETSLQVKNTYEVLEVTARISLLYKDIQLESIAFFISGDSTLIAAYASARESIFPLMGKLKSLTANNLVQQPRIDTLRALIGGLTIFTDSALDNSLTEVQLKGVKSRIMINSGFRKRIHEIISSINAEENRLLTIREAANLHSISAFNRTFFLLISGIGLLLSTTFLSVRYNFNKRIKVQQELKNANELFGKLFYESPIGIVISQLDTGEIMDCNKSFAELIGYSKSELIGNTGVKLGIMPSFDQRNVIVGSVRNNRAVKDIEVQLKPKDGDPIWLSISMQPILVNNENCLLSAILNMTFHKEAEEKIRKALISEIELSKLKSNFVTMASHEFRTPLTTILSSAFLLDSYVLGENKDKINKHICRIKTSVNLLTLILDEFLALTKIEEGGVKPKTERLNIKETLEALCHNFKGFAKPSQKIIYEHSGEEEIYSDRVLLENIVNNLVSNAIKYSSEDKEIHVYSVVNSKVHLSVKDNGIGISKNDQTHLFERFFRASNAGSIQGTGLGLHIMKHYLNMLHGSIEVISEPGKGSEFKITFDHILPVDKSI